jgi:Ca2+-binding RTX toxin-like protein
LGQYNIFTKVSGPGDGLNILVMAGQWNVATLVTDGTVMAAMIGQYNVLTRVGYDGEDGALYAVFLGQYNILTNVADGDDVFLMAGLAGNLYSKVGDGNVYGVMIGRYANIATIVGEGNAILVALRLGANAGANVITKWGDGDVVALLASKIATSAISGTASANVLVQEGAGRTWTVAAGTLNVVFKYGSGTYENGLGSNGASDDAVSYVNSNYAGSDEDDEDFGGKSYLTSALESAGPFLDELDWLPDVFMVGIGAYNVLVEANPTDEETFTIQAGVATTGFNILGKYGDGEYVGVGLALGITNTDEEKATKINSLDRDIAPLQAVADQGNAGNAGTMFNRLDMSLGYLGHTYTQKASLTANKKAVNALNQAQAKWSANLMFNVGSGFATFVGVSRFNPAKYYKEQNEQDDQDDQNNQNNQGIKEKILGLLPSNLFVKVGNGETNAIAWGDNNVLVRVGDVEGDEHMLGSYDDIQIFVGARNVAINHGDSDDIIVMISPSFVPTITDSVEVTWQWDSKTAAKAAHYTVQQAQQQPPVNQFTPPVVAINHEKDSEVQKVYFAEKEKVDGIDQPVVRYDAAKTSYVFDLKELGKDTLEFMSEGSFWTAQLFGAATGFHLGRMSQQMVSGLHNTVKGTNRGKSTTKMLLGYDLGSINQLGTDILASGWRSLLKREIEANEIVWFLKKMSHSFNFVYGGAGQDFIVAYGMANVVFGDDFTSVADMSFSSFVTYNYQWLSTNTLAGWLMPDRFENSVVGNAIGFAADRVQFGIMMPQESFRESVEWYGSVWSAFQGYQGLYFTTPPQLSALASIFDGGILQSLQGLDVDMDLDFVSAFDPRLERLEATELAENLSDSAREQFNLDTVNDLVYLEEYELGPDNWQLNWDNIGSYYRPISAFPDIASVVTLFANFQEITPYLDDGGAIATAQGLFQNFASTWQPGTTAQEADSDTIIAIGAANLIYGGDGNDVLAAMGRVIKAFGGAGSDLLVLMGEYINSDGNEGDDLTLAIGRDLNLLGGAGNDTTIAFGENVLIAGGEGNDLLAGFGSDLWITAGSGDDVLIGVAHESAMGANGGDDLVIVFAVETIYSLHDGADIIIAWGGGNVGYWGDGTDYGTVGAGDIVYGENGDDYMWTNKGVGDATLDGGEGEDTIVIFEGSGHEVYGGTEDDVVVLGAGATGIRMATSAPLHHEHGDRLVLGTGIGLDASAAWTADQADRLLLTWDSTFDDKSLYVSYTSYDERGSDLEVEEYFQTAFAGYPYKVDIILSVWSDATTASGDNEFLDQWNATHDANPSGHVGGFSWSFTYQYIAAADVMNLLAAAHDRMETSGDSFEVAFAVELETNWDTYVSVSSTDDLERLVTIKAGLELIAGEDGTDGTIEGTALSDTLIGGTGSDSLSGAGGDDWIRGVRWAETWTSTSASDTLDGGEGVDTVDFSYWLKSDSSTEGIDIDLYNSTASDLASGNDIAAISGFENAVGTAYDDVLRAANGLDGTLMGGDGADTYIFDYGSAGNVWIVDGADDDTTQTIRLYNADLDALAAPLDVSADKDVYVISYANADGWSADLTIETSTAAVFEIEVWDNGGNYLGGTDLDTLVANLDAGPTSITGSDADDTITGSYRADEIHGMAGDDVLTGGFGDDTLYGDEGDDVLSGSDGADTLDGGADDDAVDFGGESGGSGVYVNLALGYAIDSYGNIDILSNIENVYGTSTADHLFGDDLANLLVGEEGADSIKGEGGSDILVGGRGDDKLDGGTGIDAVDYGLERGMLGVRVDLSLGEAIDSYGDADRLVSIEAAIGSDNSDLLIGDAGSNLLSGGAGGDDTLVGGAGDDILDGGDDGNNTVDYSQDGGTGGVDVDLDAGTAKDSHGNDDTLINIAAVIGTAFNDTITGDDQDNLFIGGGGDDSLVGGEGNDTVLYYGESGANGVVVNLQDGSATDTHLDTDNLQGIEHVSGSRNNDVIQGDANPNILSGNQGDDTLSGGDGKDILDGGDGNDTIDYSKETGSQGIVIDLSVDVGNDIFSAVTNSTDSFGVAEGVRGIEHVIGTDFDDSITGSDVANTLVGGAGNDTIAGDVGDDTLNGGAGDDIMAGGEGSDTYLFENWTNSADADLIDNVGGGSDSDRIVLQNTTLDADDVWFLRDGDDLVLVRVGVEGTVSVKDWFSTTSDNTVAAIELDGAADRTITADNVNQLVDAMASFASYGAADVASLTTNPLESDPDLQLAVGSYWTS